MGLAVVGPRFGGSFLLLETLRWRGGNIPFLYMEGFAESRLTFIPEFRLDLKLVTSPPSAPEFGNSDPVSTIAFVGSAEGTLEGLLGSAF